MKDANDDKKAEAMLTVLRNDDGAATLNILSTEEAAIFLHLKASTLRGWRYEGKGPRSFPFGNRVFYRREDLDAWVAAQYAQAVGDQTSKAS
jgi:hypothetical protein